MSENKDEKNSSSPDVKDEKDSSSTDYKTITDSSKDDTFYTPPEGSIKEDSGKDDSGKDDSGKEDSDEENEEMALLDRPVEVTGCRARKQVERLDLSYSVPEKKLEIPEGTGQKLGEFPKIEQQLQKTSVNDLKPLHRVLFGRVGSANEIKRNVRKFCGFPFEKITPEFEKKKAIFDKFTIAVLKHMCEVLSLERGGTKEDLVTRLLDFLLKPTESGTKGKSKKKVSVSGKEKKKSSDKKVKNNDKKGKKGKVSSEEEPDSDEDNSAADASDRVSEDDVSAEIEEVPKKKSKNATKPKEAAKVKGKKNDKSADKPKKEEKKTAKAIKRKREVDSDESSEDEPLVKKTKIPSDEEITKLVKRILDNADLQEITMKKVIKQVSDAYPDCDLSHKKAFIKTTIKSVIS